MQMRPVDVHDFENALKQVKASVNSEDLNFYEQWNNKFGSVAQ